MDSLNLILVQTPLHFWKKKKILHHVSDNIMQILVIKVSYYQN